MRRRWPPALLAQRFWAKVFKPADDSDSCWLWVGPTFGRYGCFFDGERNRLAHRVAFELTVGEIPVGAVIRHRCNVKLCVRHLEAGTHEDNTADRIAALRSDISPRPITLPQMELVL